MNGNESICGDGVARATLLLVDDEPNIISSLRRLFRPLGYQVLTAEGGARGLEILRSQEVDLVVSDMRMPEMDGAEFLREVATHWPDTVRILLTGFSDISSTVSAINEAHIYRYISKPWEENDIKLAVKQALETKFLACERRRLEALTRRQNEQLKELNAQLEAKVKARTQEIQQTADMLDLAYKELKQSYVHSIPVFANLIEMREGNTKGHGRRVGQHAREVAIALGMDEEEAQNVYFAGLLHDIGKLGLPDRLLDKPFAELSPHERNEVMKHSVSGQMALIALEPLQEAALLIRHHHERFAGKGVPDGLAGEDIPLGARILAVVNEYDALQMGTLVAGKLSSAEARAFLKKNSGTRYDPAVVDVFMQLLDREAGPDISVGEQRLMSNALREGMVLSRDLANQEGILLLAKGYVLNERLIERIADVEREEEQDFVIYVRRPED